jgi:PPOX class probable F420-dependent enzyme
MLTLDTSTPFGARVRDRLQKEIVAWLTTVGPDGTPQPSPIWFLWDGQEILIYSQPNKAKLRNIARNPRVAFNFDGNGKGGDIVILTGAARIVPSEPPADANPNYLAKYDAEIRRIGMTRESFARSYSVAIRLTLDHLRGH